MKPNSKLSACLLLIFNISIQAQNPLAELPKIVGLSPEAASMERYGEYRVGYFTGVPEISIPLYEIKTKEFTIPITLNYHASGIKVCDVATWVGLGWTLNGGGQIVRKVNGLPDEEDREVRDVDHFPKKLSLSDSSYLEDVLKGRIDTEPDIYSYSVNGKNGQFIIDNNGKYLGIPYSPVRMSQKQGKFRMLDENGTSYSFDFADNPNTIYPKKPFETDPVSTWLITGIFSKNKEDSVKYSYQSAGEGTLNEDIINFITVVDHVSACGDIPYHTPGVMPQEKYHFSTTGREMVFNEIEFPTGRIKFFLSDKSRLDRENNFKSLQKIEIYSQDSINPIRTINLYQSYFINEQDSRLKLDSIEISDSHNKKVERYKFEYNTKQNLPEHLSMKRDYWGYFNNINNTTLIPRMNIEYLDYLNGTQPAQITIGSDFTNGRDPDSAFMQANILKKITYPTGGISEFKYETNQYRDAAGNIKLAGGLRIARIMSDDGFNHKLIKTYKYGIKEDGIGRFNTYINNYFFTSIPTYAFQEFVGDKSGSARSTNYISNPSIDINPIDGSPVVYPFVTEYFGDEKNNYGKTIYQYYDQQDSLLPYTRNITIPFAFKFNAQKNITLTKLELVSKAFQRGLLAKKTTLKNEKGIYSIVNIQENQYFFYPENSLQNIGAKVFDLVSANKQIDITSRAGYYNYYLVTGDNLIKQSTELIYGSNDPSNFIRKENKYKYNNSQDLQVSEISTVNSAEDIIIRKFKYSTDYLLNKGASCQTQYNSCKSSASAKYNTAIWTCLSDSSTCAVHCANLYPNDPQMYNTCKGACFSTTNCRNAANNTYKIDTTSCYTSYMDCMGLTVDNLPIFIMQGKNMISMPLEEQVLQRTNGISSLISGKFSKFKVENNNVFPDTIYALPILKSSSDTVLSTLDNYKTLKLNPGYKPEIKFDKYGLNGNILQLHKIKDTNTSYFWGYNDNLVVAELKNTTYSIIESNIVLKDLLNQLQLYRSLPDLTARNELKDLNIKIRNNIPSNCLITTFTYDPLIGMTSQTDPNGIATYYEYDDFGRLKLVKDDNGNILKTYDYHYKE